MRSAIKHLLLAMGVTVQTKRLKVSVSKVYDGAKISTINIKGSW
jgi:hypothetical protein